MADIPFLRICEVISVEDDTGGDRIKVRLTPEDNRLADKDLPYAFPFLPKIFHVKPKVGECVGVFTIMLTDAYSQRFYIGPVISQLNHLEYEPFAYDAVSYFRGSYTTPEPAQDTIPDTDGAYPKEEDVAILGRKYSDIILTENDVRLRAGVKTPDDINGRDVKFNSKNPAFIKLKYNNYPTLVDNDEYNSTAAVVADKIFLLGNSPKDGNVITTDREELISDDKMAELISKAHELPYGDKLIEFLKMFRDAFVNHTHNFPTMPTCQSNEIKNLQNYNLEDIVSDSVRIN